MKGPGIKKEKVADFYKVDKYSQFLFCRLLDLKINIESEFQERKSHINYYLKKHFIV